MEPQVIVVGGGIGGAAAALRAAQYHLRTVWVLGDKGTEKSSRSRYVVNIDNMIGIHDGVLKAPLLKRIEDRCPEGLDVLGSTHDHIGTRAIVDNVIERLEQEYTAYATLIRERATGARRRDGGFGVTTASESLQAPFLVLATGVADRQPRIKKSLASGRTLDGIHWIFPYANHETVLYCVRCEGHLTAGTPTAVLGSSPAAGQVALMLHERYGTPVTVLTNGEVPGFPAATRRLLQAYGIAVRDERLVDVLGKARQGDLRGFELEGGDQVEVRFALVALGLHRVFNDLAVELGCELEEGPVETSHVLVDREGETEVPGCFAVGDMATHRDAPIRKQVYTAQEYAVRAVDVIDRRTRAARRARLLDGGPEPGA